MCDHSRGWGRRDVEVVEMNEEGWKCHVCEGHQTGSRQGEEVGRRIQVIARRFGWKEDWRESNRFERDQQVGCQSGKMGGMDSYGMVGDTEANGVCCGDKWATNGKD